MTITSKAHTILGLATFAVLVSSAAFATSMLESAQGKAAEAVVVVPAKTTTTVETTTATSYTVSTRKVGMVGGRPYKPREQELEGGLRKDITVNGVKVESEVIVADTVAPVKNTVAEGDYYTGKPDAIKVYEQTESNIHVHNTGRLNR